MENRFENRFAELDKKGEGAFLPFVTLCDPNYDTSLKILKALIRGGADALELGFPFSDPCADGPVIQNGPQANPKFPPTEKIDMLLPSFAPPKVLAILPPAGWKIAEPIPFRQTSE